jgi:hypothetical protein
MEAASGRPLSRKRSPAARPGEVLRSYTSTERASQLLGFAGQPNLLEGINTLSHWYQNNPGHLLKEETSGPG